MRNNKLVNTGLILVSTFVFFVIGKAQSGSIQFSNGITVAIKTETVPPNDKNSFENGFSSGTGYNGNTVHRVMTDTKNKIYFGYDLDVEKQGESGKFKISIKPLSKTPAELFRQNSLYYRGFTAKSLPKYPEPFILDDGDSITLDILENRQTQTKISDIIKITSKPQKFFSYFSDREKAKDFTIEDVLLHLDKPEISINGQKNNHGGGASGNVIWLYIPGKGRFIFSFRPQPEFNFQKAGIVSDDKILFEYNGEKYEIVNKSAVLGSGGKWNLWVMFDENYKPTDSGSSSYEFGATDEVKYLFDFK
ncbi:MAG: hypothetical protein ABIP06_15280 [Pyrinomonadaceae bacterium]